MIPPRYQEFPAAKIPQEARADGTMVRVITGRPLGEPVHRAGPFAMATREDLLSAFDDFRTVRI